jgi:hypothetical protein
MAPKPFNPPRPKTSTGAGRGRPKGSTGKRKSTTASGSGVEKVRKSKDKGKGIDKGKGKEIERTSTLSARSLLPSLSPDSSQPSNPPENEEDSDDPFSSQPLRRSTHKQSTHNHNRNPSPSPQAEDNNNNVEDERKETIPEDLLNVLIHQFFKQEGTRMSKDANRAVGRYMETFVRVALARAAWAREEGGEGGGGGDLEVEDLERLAPQLVLDF